MTARANGSKTFSRFAWAALSAILLVAAALRLWDLGGPSLWTDELYSVSFARLPQGLLWSDWMVRETNPPLYYYLLNIWMSLFGEGEFAVRSMTVGLGLLAIGVVFLLGRALHSTSAGLIAAALMAVSAQQLQYSQQARGYVLGLLVAGLAILALIRLTDRWRAGGSDLRQTLPDLLLYVGATAIAFYTHTTLFILPVLANLYMAWVWFFRTPRRWKDAAGWLGANVLLAAICAWWIWITIRQIGAGAGPIAWIEEPTIRDAIAKTGHVLATRSIDSLNILFAALFGVIISWGVWRLSLERRVLAVTFGVGVPFLLFAVSQAQPVFMERTLFWVQAIYFPCLAAGILALPRPQLRLFGVAALVAILLVDAVNWRGREYQEPWREIGSVLRDQAGPQDAVVAYDADAAVNLAYYCRQIGCTKARVFALKTPAGRDVLAEYFQGVVLDKGNAREELAGFDRIWVMQRGLARKLNDDPTQILSDFAREETPDVLDEATTRDGKVGGAEMNLAIWRPIGRQ